MPFVLPFVEELEHSVDARLRPKNWIDVEPHLPEQAQDLGLRSGATGWVERVDESVEAPAGGDPRVKLPDGAGSRVPGVGEERFSLPGQLGVEALEAAFRHIDLAPDLECRRELGRYRDAERNARDRLDVGGHVLADIAVPSGGADGISTVLIEEAHGEAVDFQLRHVLDLHLTEGAADPAVELAHLIPLERVVQAQHGHPVSDLGERVRGRTANSLGG